MARLTFEEFRAKYAGQKVGFVAGFLGQCVQLVRAYVAECLGLPQLPGVGSAYQWAEKPLGNDWVWTANGPANYPAPGAILVWGQAYGPDGHTAVVVDANAQWLTAFSQNDPLGSPAGERRYSYRGVKGWITPEVAPVVPPEPDIRWALEYFAQQGVPLDQEEKARAMLDALFAKVRWVADTELWVAREVQDAG